VPSREQVRAQVSKAIGSLSNERAKGRVNDGFTSFNGSSQWVYLEMIANSPWHRETRG